MFDETVGAQVTRCVIDWEIPFQFRPHSLSRSSHAGTQMARRDWLRPEETPIRRGTAIGGDHHWLTIQAVGIGGDIGC